MDVVQSDGMVVIKLGNGEQRTMTPDEAVSLAAQIRAAAAEAEAVRDFRQKQMRQQIAMQWQKDSAY